MRGFSSFPLLLSCCSVVFANRLIQIPDIHGDFDLMKHALSLVEPLDPEKDHLVFTGDFVDRGPAPKECYDLSEELSKKYNVTRLLGNHEWITLMGVGPRDPFAEYVTAEDLASFGGWDKRRHEFGPHGHYGKMIREGFNAIAIESIPGEADAHWPALSKTLFVHAGITLQMLKTWGGRIGPMREQVKYDLEHENLENAMLNEILQTRHQAQGPNPQAVCKEVTAILQLAGAERMVVGHTPTPLLPGGEVGKPIVRCEGRYLLTDVAMSRWMGGGRASVMIMESDDTNKLNKIYFKGHDGQKTVEVPVLGPIDPEAAEEMGSRTVEL